MTEFILDILQSHLFFITVINFITVVGIVIAVVDDGAEEWIESILNGKKSLKMFSASDL